MARGRYSALGRPASRSVPACIHNPRVLGGVLCLAVLQQRPPGSAYASGTLTLACSVFAAEYSVIGRCHSPCLLPRRLSLRRRSWLLLLLLPVL